MADPMVALQVQTPGVNGAANFAQGAQAHENVNTSHLANAQASIGMIGSVALGAMGGDINGQVDPAKWAQGMALLKAHGLPVDGLTPQSAPVIARSSMTTLGQLQAAQNQREFELHLQEFGNTLNQQKIDNNFKAAEFNQATHDTLVPNSMFGLSTPDAQRAQSGLPPIPMFGPNGQPMPAPAAPAPQPGAAPAAGATPAPGADQSAAQPVNPRTGAMGLPDVALGPDGRPDPAAQEAFLAALPPQLAGLVKAAAEYRLTPSQVFTMRSGNDRAMFDAVMAKYDPTYDATQYAARQSYAKNITSGPIAMNVNSASTAIGHLYGLLGKAQALDNSSFVPWNSVANTAKTMTGKPEVTNFDINAKAVTDELAKFFKGTGATDVGSIESWHSSLSHDASQEQTAGAVDTAIGLLKSRMDVLEQQYMTTMGHAPPAGYATFMRPDAQEALTKMGYDPVTMEKTGAGPGTNQPEAGANTKTINGVTYTKDANGDWTY